MSAKYYYTISAMLFILGIGLICVDVLRGNAKFILVVFIPILYGEGVYSLLGSVCIIIAIFVGFYGIIKRFELEYVDAEERVLQPETKLKQKTETKKGGVLLIGPFPIIYGSDKQTVYILIILTIIVIILSLFFFLLLFRSCM